MASRAKDPNNPQDGGMDPPQVQEIFVQEGRFTAGFDTRYPQSILTGGRHYQQLATCYPIGERFHSAPVTRIAGAMESRSWTIGIRPMADL